MFYCVVPRELEAELLERLRAHYADDPEMVVIVDRREAQRRGCGIREGATERRVLRDRRRRRVCGELPALYGEAPAGAA